MGNLIPLIIQLVSGAVGGNIAGSLMLIGEGKREVNWAQEVLKACDRRVAAATAPANGLYLAKVYY